MSCFVDYLSQVGQIINFLYCFGKKKITNEWRIKQLSSLKQAKKWMSNACRSPWD